MSEKTDLDSIRNDISDIDREILELLAKRKDVCLDAANSKAANQKDLRDQTREEEVIAVALKKSKELGLDTHYVHSIFNEILALDYRSRGITIYR